MNDDPRKVHLHIPAVTLIKIGLFVLLAYLLTLLYSLLEMLFLAALVAVILAAATDWLVKKGVRRPLGLVFTAGLMFGLFAVFVIVIIPNTVAELQKLVKETPRIAKSVSQSAPALAPYLQAVSREVQQPPNPQSVKQWAARGVVAGRYVVAGLTTIILTLVLAVYLVVEGKRAFAWLVSFAPDAQRKKLAQTAEEVQPVMLAYMRGQLITSTLSALAALSVLLPLGVPAAVPLAVLAFIGDFVPVVGFIAAVVPAVLLALLKGPGAALIVAVVYLSYQALENYVIGPRVYGKSMRLSTLTVMVSIIVGGMIMGPVGSILMLPLAAAYPAVERIWLRKHLPEGTVARHEAIESDSDAVSERATDKALET